METAKLTDFLYNFNFYMQKQEIYPKPLIKRLNKSSECFEELY